MMSARWIPKCSPRSWAALWLILAGSWAVVTCAANARAQSCPSAYAACDNGGCCLSSDQCCPMLEDGCCSAYTPFCCGDGTCAASPAECANAGRNTCSDYDVPCGDGCAPAGSQCCDLVGHYCPPQGICMTETTCRAGNTDSIAQVVIAAPLPPSAVVPERTPSPLVDPADGTARSCALAPAGVGRRAHGAELLLLAAAALAATRRRPAARSASGAPHVAAAKLRHMNVLRRMKHPTQRASWMLLGAVLASCALGCQRTVEGISEDTREVRDRARDSAAGAKQSLDREVGAFKTEADAKLQELTVSINALKAKAHTNLDGSREKLEAELNDTRQQVAQLKADSSAQWQKTKQDLDQRIAELGRELNHTLDIAGGSLEKAGDKVEHALSPSEPKPSE